MAARNNAKPDKAPAKNTKPAAKGKQLAKYDEELAKYAEAAAASEANAGMGLQSFSLKAGVLSLNDAPMPGNEMAVIILDHIFDTTFYEGAYDPDNPAPPSAYSLGRDENEMRWSDDSIAPYAGELVKDSDINQFGSAEKGRGKAARNMRRLLVIPAGDFNKNGEFEMIEEADHYERVQPAFLKVPPTSVTNFAVFVKKLAGALRKPPFAVATRILVVPDAKTQFKVTFEVLEEMPDELVGILIERHKEAAELIMQPYNLEEREERPQRGRGRQQAPAARGRQQAPARGKAQPERNAAPARNQRGAAKERDANPPGRPGRSGTAPKATPQRGRY